MVSSAKKIGKYVGVLKDASRQLLGKQLSRAVSSRAASAVASPMSFAKGGKVHRTGMAKVHKGELVLTAKQTKAMKRLLK